MEFEKVVSFYKRAAEKGYQAFFSPAFEKINHFQDKTVVFFDRRGNFYALREDFTKSVVDYKKRLGLAMVKVWYADYVYRYTMDELTAEYQLGVEKIPRRDPKDTLEVLEIIVSAAVEFFGNSLIVEISDTRVYEDLLKEVPQELHKTVLDLVDSKNLAEIEFLSRVKRLDLSRIEKIIEDSFYRREVEHLESLDVRPEVRERLKETASFLKDHFPEVEVEVDLTLARTVEEYNGLIFIVYDSNTSKLVAAGGEYSSNGEIGVGGTIYLEGKTC